MTAGHVVHRTKKNSSMPLSWPWILVLVGSAGVLGLAFVTLSRALQSAEGAARVEAARSAADVARGLRVALSEPDFLEIVPVERRFVVEEGRVQIPQEVAWLETPMPVTYTDNLEAPIGELVREARRAESVDADRAAALELLDE